MQMGNLRVLVVLCMVLMAGAVAAGQSQASDRGRDNDRGGERTMADRAISLDEAVAQAERRYDARAVRAEEKRHDGRIEYRIRLLGADGRVFEVRIDAETGGEI